MSNLGKLGTALIATIEDLIANGPSEEGEKEDRADVLMAQFLAELDAIYVDPDYYTKEANAYYEAEANTK